jgi:folate-binding protein YgfZ
MNLNYLEQRGIIAISGADKADYLQGIITQDVRLINAEHMIYSCFLTPQGKYLADFFITQYEDMWLLDVDYRLKDDLIKRLALYRLRSRVTLEDVSDQYKVFVSWANASVSEGFMRDPRHESLGWRKIVKNDQDDFVQHGDYILWCYQNGVPSYNDFISERSMMLEYNMDLLNALSFDKGCYMGQELTARTHYRGLIKKRLLPIKFDDTEIVDFESAVQKDNITIGAMRSSYKGFGLAVLQLDNLHDGDSVMVNDHSAKIFFPEWFKLTQP